MTHLLEIWITESLLSGHTIVYWC